MDFTFSPEADEAAGLAAQVLAGFTSNEQLRAVEATGDRFDAALWSALGETGLLSLGVPEANGGAGLGLIELARVLVEAGRVLAPVPLADHLAAAYVLAEVAPTSGLLAKAASGEAILSIAHAEPLEANPTQCLTTGSETVSGVKVLVRSPHRGAAFLVTTDSGLFLMDANADGVAWADQHTSDGEVVGQLTLSDAPATHLGGPDAVSRLTEVLTVLRCAEQLGRLQGAQTLTAAYARTREQFGRPIGTFQAVSQRLADGYVDVLGADLTLWQAAWRLEEGLPAATEVAVAKLWAADAGHKVAHTTVHVHGGVGIDLDGEAHRYFTGLKRAEFELGGTTGSSRRVGQALAG